MDERLAAAGGVSGSLVDAFRALLKGECLWGAQELAAASRALLPKELCNANALQAERSLLSLHQCTPCAYLRTKCSQHSQPAGKLKQQHVCISSSVWCLCCVSGPAPTLPWLCWHAFLLSDPSLDGTFKAFAINLPGSSELLDRIPEADPLLLYQVCVVPLLV